MILINQNHLINQFYIKFLYVEILQRDKSYGILVSL